MRILYGIQGTGNGHISRARDIVPALQQFADVDILVSGTQADVQLPYPITYKYHGMGFVFGKKGGVDLLDTFIKARTRVFYRELKTLPVEQYDLVISDFEPVTSWACYSKDLPCIGLSHQAAVLAAGCPLPAKSDMVGKLVLKNYAPVTTAYGFHFAAYAPNVFTPVIRQQIRQAQVTNDGHYTVYLPAYDDERIIKNLLRFPQVQWQVFSKHNIEPIKVQNVEVQPISNDAFIASFTSCEGLLCGAGFETPAEALFMKKKVLVTPMKNQYEQHCNAAAIATLGVPILKKLKKKHLDPLADWLENGQVIEVDYPDETEEIIALVLYNHAQGLRLSLAEFRERGGLALVPKKH